MRRNRLFLGIVLLLVSTLILSIGNSSIFHESDDRASFVLAREVHDPITIYNNTNLLEQKYANNWTGTGEPDSPITISDYRIEFSYEGITLMNVDLSWAIVNCETGDYDTQYWGSTGIKIVNCSNGVIEDSLAHMKDIGIFIEKSHHISLSYNMVHDCANGVIVSESKHIVVHKNNLGWNDWVGLNFTYTDRCTATDNSIIAVPDFGIQCLFDKNTYLAGNEISSTYLEDEYDEFENIGIFNYGSWNLAMWSNYIHECVIGLEMWMVNGSWFWENKIGNCTEFCIRLADGTFNVTIVRNCIGPTNGTNAYDSGEFNHWDEPYDEIGNHWSDYNGTGVYNISGPAGSVDHYPNRYTCEDSEPTSTTPQETTSSETGTTSSTSSTSSTSPTTGFGDEEFQQMILLVSISSSLVILLVVVLIVRSGKGA